MISTSVLENYIHLCDIIDNNNTLHEQLQKLAEWIKDRLEVKAVYILKYQDKTDSAKIFTIEACSNGPAEKKLKSPRISLDVQNNNTILTGTECCVSESSYAEYVSPAEQKTKILYIPVSIDEKNTIGAFLLLSENPDSLLKEEELTLKLFAFKLKSLLLIKTENEHKTITDFLELAEQFGLDGYIMDLNGNFTYMSSELLKKLKYLNVLEITLHGSIFISEKERKRELEIIQNTGKVINYELILLSKDKNRFSMRDTAFRRGDIIIGLFFDITEFVIQKNELHDSLEMQQFLNDRIFETITMLQKTQITAIKTLARLAEYRDQETGDHLQRIREYSKLLSSEVFRKNPYSFKISQGYSNDMYLSSMLHDIGKVGVPDNILLKPGRLENEEWKIMQNHTIWGWAILSEADKELGEQSFLTLAAIIALYHHERYDGTGYPKALKGDNIPLSARIASLADVYDALTSKRVYKDAWPHEQVIEEFIRQRGKQFDPILVDIFLEIEQQFLKIRRAYPG